MTPQWEKMQSVEFVRWRMGRVQMLIVTRGRARDTLPEVCPVCGKDVEVVRRWKDGKRWLYYTLHEGEVHDLGSFGPT